MPQGQEDKSRVPVDLKAPKAKRGKHSFEKAKHVYTRLLL